MTVRVIVVQLGSSPHLFQLEVSHTSVVGELMKKPRYIPSWISTTRIAPFILLSRAMRDQTLRIETIEQLFEDVAQAGHALPGTVQFV